MADLTPGFALPTTSFVFLPFTQLSPAYHPGHTLRVDHMHLCAQIIHRVQGFRIKRPPPCKLVGHVLDTTANPTAPPPLVRPRFSSIPPPAGLISFKKRTVSHMIVVKFTTHSRPTSRWVRMLAISVESPERDGRCSPGASRHLPPRAPSVPRSSPARPSSRERSRTPVSPRPPPYRINSYAMMYNISFRL